MSDTDRLQQFVEIVRKCRAAQRAFHSHRGASVVECKRLEAAVDRWLDEQGFTAQRKLFPQTTT